MYIVWIVSFSFGLFVFLDVLSAMPRMAGSIIGLNGLAYSFQVMVATLKRVLIVTYPPFVGLAALKGGAELVVLAIAGSYFLGMISVTLCFAIRVPLVSFFCAAISSYGDGVGLWKAVRNGYANRKKWKGDVIEKIWPYRGFSALKSMDYGVFIPAVWIFFFYGASVFVVNLVSLKFPDLSPVILQTTGFVNALGTLALAFYLDPKISVRYENKKSVFSVSYSIVGAHVVNLFLVGPAFFLFVVVFFDYI
ncbi:hypothetical protein [Alcanivorax hongdengensis]|uniref:hypothetical protein n=1 Tax=Alcanivorax hongdengensis TaxID=519051 RepID=UPI0012F88CE4|nr:hypothetical protein [Alcanivorax hongdengensis]